MEFTPEELTLIRTALGSYRVRAPVGAKNKAKIRRLEDKILLSQLGVEV